MCPISVSELPSEILEHILLSLPPAEIMKMREVSRLFLDVVYGSQHLQHRIDLFGSGLVDNPHTRCNLAERRARLRKYTDGWKDTKALVRCVRPLEYPMSTLDPLPCGQDLFSARAEDGTAISFIRGAPSPSSQEKVEEWTVALPFHFGSYVVFSQDNLLAVLEQGIGLMNIHLLNLSDGSPHEKPLQKVITLDLGHFRGPLVTDMQISGSRIALVIEVSSFTMTRHHRELIVWDWRTGGVVLEYLSDDTDIGSAVGRITGVRFLEESWLLAPCYGGPTPQLLVLNTLLPQQDPRSWRILGLPPPPGPSICCSILTHYEKPLAECPGFSVDPTQRIFAVLSQDNRALVTPTELFVQRMCSARPNPCIPWDEWLEDAIIVELHSDTVTLQLFDTKVLALCAFPGGWGVRMYDLSKLGRGDIQVQQAGEGGGCRRVLSTPKWFARRQIGIGGTIPYGTQLVGNKVVCFSVRGSHSGSAYSLHVWKMG